MDLQKITEIVEQAETMTPEEIEVIWNRLAVLTERFDGSKENKSAKPRSESAAHTYSGAYGLDAP